MKLVRIAAMFLGGFALIWIVALNPEIPEQAKMPLEIAGIGIMILGIIDGYRARA